jgi:DNA-binding IclR family transcriptional regulator
VATPRNNSVRKAFSLLMVFRHADEWVTCSELSRRAQLPEPSGNRLLQTLEEVGAVVRGVRGSYRPGLMLLSLSRNVAVDDCLRAAARDIMSDMSRRLNATVHLARLEGSMVVFIEKFSTPESCQIQTFPGARFEPYSLGLGKVLLAGLPGNALDKFILDDELVPMTPNTITTEPELRDELDKVRREGFATDNCEFHADIACVAVPVRDTVGRTVAAMSITEKRERMSRQRQLELRAALIGASARLSDKVFPVSAPLARTAT